MDLHDLRLDPSCICVVSVHLLDLYMLEDNA